jgi:hypothetical protein
MENRSRFGCKCSTWGEKIAFAILTSESGMRSKLVLRGRRIA